MSEILKIIIQLLAIIGWLSIIWSIITIVKALNIIIDEIKGVYGGICLLLWKAGFLIPEKKGKKIGKKKVSLVFNVEMLKAVDAKWCEKD